MEREPGSEYRGALRFLRHVGLTALGLLFFFVAMWLGEPLWVAVSASLSVLIVAALITR